MKDEFEVIKNKIKSYEKDMKKLIKIINLSDRIDSPGIRIKFDEFIIIEIQNLSKMIKNLKEFVERSEKEDKE